MAFPTPPGGGTPFPNFSSIFGNPQWGAWNAWGRTGDYSGSPWDDWYNQFMKMYGKGAPWATPGPTPDYHVPEGFSYQIDASQLQADPMDVVRSARPKIQEEMNRNFAKAANRMGGIGMLGSSAYTSALGEASRKASNDLANVYYQALTQAAENQAAREMQAALANQSTAERAWATHGGWDVGLQEAAMRDLMNQWAQTGNWNAQWAEMANDPVMRLLSMATKRGAGTSGAYGTNGPSMSDLMQLIGILYGNRAGGTRALSDAVSWIQRLWGSK